MLERPLTFRFTLFSGPDVRGQHKHRDSRLGVPISSHYHPKKPSRILRNPYKLAKINMREVIIKPLFVSIFAGGQTGRSCRCKDPIISSRSARPLRLWLSSPWGFGYHLSFHYEARGFLNVYVHKNASDVQMLGLDSKNMYIID